MGTPLWSAHGEESHRWVSARGFLLQEHGLTRDLLSTLDSLRDANDYWGRTYTFVWEVLTTTRTWQLSDRRVGWRDKILADLDEGRDRGSFISLATDDEGWENRW